MAKVETIAKEIIYTMTLDEKEMSLVYSLLGDMCTAKANEVLKDHGYDFRVSHENDWLQKMYNAIADALE